MSVTGVPSGSFRERADAALRDAALRRDTALCGEPGGVSGFGGVLGSLRDAALREAAALRRDAALREAAALRRDAALREAAALRRDAALSRDAALRRDRTSTSITRAATASTASSCNFACSASIAFLVPITRCPVFRTSVCMPLRGAAKESGTQTLLLTSQTFPSSQSRF